MPTLPLLPSVRHIDRSKIEGSLFAAHCAHPTDAIRSRWYVMFQEHAQVVLPSPLPAFGLERAM